MLSPDKMIRIAALTQLADKRPLDAAEQAEREQLLAQYHQSLHRDFHQAMEGLHLPGPGNPSEKG